MRLLKIFPDAETGCRVDDTLSVLFDPAELLRRRIVEYKHDWRLTAWQIEILVEHIRNRDRPIPELVNQLEIFAELTALACIRAVLIANDVILEDRNPAELIGRESIAFGSYRNSRLRR